MQSKFNRVAFSIFAAITGVYWIISGVEVAFSKGSSTGPMGPYYSSAQPDLRVSQGGVLAFMGVVVVGIAVYLVFYYDND